MFHLLRSVFLFTTISIAEPCPPDCLRFKQYETCLYRLNIYVYWNIRIAPEVFMKITPTRRASEKHYRRLEEFAPKTGTVRVLKLTEKQYDSIYLLSGELDNQEKTVGRNCHIML